jgi:hypothetical protein
MTPRRPWPLFLGVQQMRLSEHDQFGDITLAAPTQASRGCRHSLLALTGRR